MFAFLVSHKKSYFSKYGVSFREHVTHVVTNIGTSIWEGLEQLLSQKFLLWNRMEYLMDILQLGTSLLIVLSKLWNKYSLRDKLHIGHGSFAYQEVNHSLNFKIYLMSYYGNMNLYCGKQDLGLKFLKWPHLLKT